MKLFSILKWLAKKCNDLQRVSSWLISSMCIYSFNNINQNKGAF